MTTLPHPVTRIGDALQFGALLLVALLMHTTPVFSQVRARVPASSLSSNALLPKSGAGDESSTQLDLLPPAYLDQVIDPSDYRVGPGDVIYINIWGERPELYEIEITPEASLIIPGVGDMQVKGLTLTELKSAATERLRAYYPRIPISITLGKVRRFRVTVTGAVENPGLHVVTANTRASEVLGKAGLRDDAARRQVRLQRPDSTLIVDLAAFERLGLRDANPYLSEGDVLIVPPLDRRWGTVRIDGAVNLGGEFGFSPGDLVNDLIELAYSLRPDADTTRLELWRFTSGNADAQRWEWPAGTTYSHWKLFALQPDDRLIVRSVEDYRPKNSVSVTGEIVRPGAYVFPGESIPLRDVIDSAGGFTKLADITHAQIIRIHQPLWVEESRERLGRIPAELRSQSESDQVLADALTARGRVAADFRRLFVDGDQSYNVPLFDGDEVIIPRLTASINVLGRVVRPGLVPHEPGADLGYYLARVGGYAWQADRGGTFLVKGATGAAVKKGRISEIEAGDTIVVPTRKGRKWWNAFRETLTVATSLATIYLVVDQVTQ